MKALRVAYMKITRSLDCRLKSQCLKSLFSLQIMAIFVIIMDSTFLIWLFFSCVALAVVLLPKILKVLLGKSKQVGRGLFVWSVIALVITAAFHLLLIYNTNIGFKNQGLIFWPFYGGYIGVQVFYLLNAWRNKVQRL